ncbi:unnamed protein product [Schistocephalus solidus]|uniref:ANK_REP_REGION domain-containing protein n=1 Tax=Schistocephalus solidus TaxID=70667 RepID=A0A183SGV8_SCHSO|nr:unnamed protein product [Schistocephalus solidus]
MELVPSYREQTALHKAAAYRRRRICEALVRARASLLSEDRKGQTPRLLALTAKDDRLALFLHLRKPQFDRRFERVLPRAPHQSGNSGNLRVNKIIVRVYMRCIYRTLSSPCPLDLGVKTADSSTVSFDDVHPLLHSRATQGR